ncbi:16S rRNA (guanine(527)-N(7))-methyltransferase RsmG [bacterium NHP-B]|nr:16S rRNA (guanine(527)-N(7))-methyltransferase RsmG [bacterium NHP-B]
MKSSFFSPSVNAQLERYIILIHQWNAHMNLVAPGELANKDFFFTRHIIDSAQLSRHLPPTSPLVDIGTGAGLPGIVLALMETRPVHLVEPREKRILFLEKACAHLGLHHVTLHHDRIEHLSLPEDSVFVSRAFRPLPNALPLLKRHLREETHYLCLKGASWSKEVADAQQGWHFDLADHPSLTHAKSRILHLSRIRIAS